MRQYCAKRDPRPFQEFLVKNGYAETVIRVYVRIARKYVQCQGVRPTPSFHEELKNAISEYLAAIPISFNKNMVQAALHSYYRFLSGNRFASRLCADDFESDAPIETEIVRLRKHLSEMAGLSANTVTSTCNTIRAFLYWSFPAHGFTPDKITADVVRKYFTHALTHVSAASKKTLIGRIRNYVRFQEFTYGYCSEEVLSLPMTSPVWKHAGLPRFLSDLEFEKLISAYDRTKPDGIRDYAIVRCLKDLGLRCAEVAQLSLDDFGWDLGTITIRKSKSHSQRTLPLPRITGQAIEAYLSCSRPAIPERTLLVRSRGDRGLPMGTSMVRNTVRCASIRAGLTHYTGTHMLRHAAAARMVNQGVELKVIADILGHESIGTTTIYTKLHIDRLRGVAGTWPGVMP